MAAENTSTTFDAAAIPELDNACKTLLANIGFSSIETPIKTIVVTSTNPAEGKSTTAVNLAHAMAMANKKVLVIENDFRHRSVRGVLNEDPKVGIYSLLSGKCKLDRAIRETHIPNLYFLNAEKGISNPTALLGSVRYESLLKNLRNMFDYIVIDTPPTGTFPGVPMVGAIADGVVYVLRRDYTKTAEVKKCLAQLQQANANVIGIVMTFCKSSHDDYYYYYQSGGKKKGRGSGDAVLSREDSIDSDATMLDSGSLEDWESFMGFDSKKEEPTPQSNDEFDDDFEDEPLDWDDPNDASLDDDFDDAPQKTTSIKPKSESSRAAGAKQSGRGASASNGRKPRTGGTTGASKRRRSSGIEPNVSHK